MRASAAQPVCTALSASRRPAFAGLFTASLSVALLLAVGQIAPAMAQERPAATQDASASKSGTERSPVDKAWALALSWDKEASRQKLVLVALPVEARAENQWLRALRAQGAATKSEQELAQRRGDDGALVAAQRSSVQVAALVDWRIARKREVAARTRVEKSRLAWMQAERKTATLRAEALELELPASSDDGAAVAEAGRAIRKAGKAGVAAEKKKARLEQLEAGRETLVRDLRIAEDGVRTATRPTAARSAR